MTRRFLHGGLLAAALIGLGFSGGAVAAGGGNNECPVDVLEGSPGTPDTTLDLEFGPYSAEITHCLKRRHKVKLVVQVNQYCARTDTNGVCTRPYALHNIDNVINDYEVTNGMVQGQDYEIAAIVHSGGGTLLLDPNASTPHPNAGNNQFAQNVKDLMEAGVKFYFCQNTARGMHVTTDQLIPGVEYVTAGISALADFQSNGWTYVQP